MKKNIFFFALLVFFLGRNSTTAQDIDPVKWSTTINKINDNEFDLIVKGKIEKNWHLFSQFTNEGGSLPTEFEFLNTEGNYKTLGLPKESETKTSYNAIFEVDETYFTEKVIFTQRVQLLNAQLPQINLMLHYQVCNEVCMNKEKLFVFAINGNAVTDELVKIDAKSQKLADQLHLDLKNKSFLENTKTEKGKENNLWNIFILGFLGGLVALLTPCVFPMIPLTVSFFTKQNSNKAKGISHAVLYGFFIICIYLALSIPFHFLDSINPEILNTISTNIWLNVIFFVIFVVFAFSFFGYFEITLPNSWSTKMDSASNIGGIIGIFFMALTLALVSFSCTGPILGSLLAGSLTADGGAIQLTVGMVGFGSALALPFTLFAFFPNLLKSLPKSGGWLSTVKIILGFVELALAFKFLSNADLVGHWGILKREIFIGIWIIIFALLALYFFGVLRFPHDGKKKLGFARISFGILVASFCVYLVSGLKQDSSLKLLSGFPPPSFYSIYDQASDCPLDLNCFKNFEEGVAYAKKNNKPILLDFTGWACVNCRKMEENVWSDPKVYEILKNNYVLISLYIDDRKALSENEKFDININNKYIKSIKTVGDKWATFQYINFNTTSQPYYVTLSADLKILNPPKQYVGTDEYYTWLKSSLKNKDSNDVESLKK